LLIIISGHARVPMFVYVLWPNMLSLLYYVIVVTTTVRYVTNCCDRVHGKLLCKLIVTRAGLL